MKNKVDTHMKISQPLSALNEDCENPLTFLQQSIHLFQKKVRLFHRRVMKYRQPLKYKLEMVCLQYVLSFGHSPISQERQKYLPFQKN